jgi:hypothetical protein
MRSTSLLAAALLAVSSSAAIAASKSAPYVGVYAFNSCKHAGKDSLTLRPKGDYRFGWASGTWKKDGNVIVINWAIRKQYQDKVRSGPKAGELRYRLLRTKRGGYALRNVKGGELMYRCKTAA